MWRALRHLNVLLLLGVIMTKNQLVMVSEWMPNRSINQFMREHQDVNPFELVSCPFKFPLSLSIVGDSLAPIVV